MIIALTGATGIVGRFVVDYLAAQGHSVAALVRPTARRGGFAQAPAWVVGDLDNEAALAELLDGTQALVHCAFTHVPGRYRGGEGDDLQGFWRTNFGGTVRLLRLARQAGVARVVLMSSRAVFARREPGEDPTTTVADDYPPRPDTQYGLLKRAEEQLASAAGDLPVCALRPTGVYGVTHPVDQSKWFALIRQVLAGAPLLEGRSSTEVHGADVAQAIGLLLNAPAAQVQGLAFNCSDITLTTRDLVQRVANIAGVAPVAVPHSDPVVNPMSCRRLDALGWRPGGEARLETTLSELIQAVRIS